MMILTKGKHNFWSQLLLSMIAIFALPASQSQNIKPQLPIVGENIQSINKIQQLIQLAIAEKKAKQPIFFTTNSINPPKKLSLIAGHFVDQERYLPALIRAGPHLFF